MAKSKIIFIGLYNGLNLGDPVIAHSTEWLFSQYSKTIEKCTRLPIFPRFSIFIRVIEHFKRVINSSFIIRCIESSLCKYYDKNIADNCVIITTGGGLIKYKYQNIDLAIISLLKVAYKKKAIVVFNSVGVEGYDEHSDRCQRLKKEILNAINNKTLQYISTRDDLFILKEKYLNGNCSIPCFKVADPAVWCSDAFGVYRDLDSKTIGVGIIRGDIFYDNNIPYSKEELRILYIDIIRELKKRDFEVKLFTNGLLLDNLFAKEIQIELEEKYGINYELILPSSPLELIKIISKFKGVIAGRLHSCIIAYSLDIPAVGLVWNDKLIFWGQNIGAEENFIVYKQFSSSYIVSQLQIAINKGYSLELLKEFKQTIKKSIEEISHLYLS